MSTPIYVVIGTTGEYSDRKEWPVAWYATEVEAEKHSMDASAAAAAFKRDPETIGEQQWNPAYKTAMAKYGLDKLDPCFEIDYTGTTYEVWKVPAGE